MISKYIRILRPEQWYKNFLVFMAIIYSFNLFDFNKFIATFLGFAALSVLSSANYLFNDIIDKKSDSKNPLKKSRPIASGHISVNAAYILLLILLAMGLSISFILNYKFFLTMAVFVASSGAYTLFLKKEIFVDIFVIALNFVIRAVSGALIINVYVSPWLILCPFLLSLFISVGKRRAEISTCGKNASMYRNTLSYYTEELTNSMMVITTTALVISYTFYTLSVDNKLLFTLPFVLYGIFRYFYFIYTKPIIAANPELVFKDARFMLSLAFWLVTTFSILYFNF